MLFFIFFPFILISYSLSIVLVVHLLIQFTWICLGRPEPERVFGLWLFWQNYVHALRGETRIIVHLESAILVEVLFESDPNGTKLSSLCTGFSSMGNDLHLMSWSG